MRRSLLIVTPEYPPQGAGVGTFLAGVASGFARRGWETSVIIPKTPGDGRSHHQVTSDDYPRIVHRYTKIPGWELVSVFLKGLSIIKRQHPAFILLGHWYPHSIVALAWRLLTGTPYFVIIHGTELFPYNPHPMRHLIKRVIFKSLPFFLSRADGLLPNSKYTKDVLQRKLRVNNGRIVILHPPVARKFFEPTNRDEQMKIRREFGLMGKRVILTVGSLVPRKGVSRVLEAMPSILETEPKAHYLIVGDGPEQDAIRRQVASLGLESVVSYTGKVPHGQLPTYYAVADLFAMISCGLQEENEVETFGIVYLEAAASGKPVVAGTQGGVVDAIIDDTTGLLVDPNDTRGISDAISYLLANPARARAMGRAGCERARSQFAPEVIAGDALRAISELLQQPEFTEPE